MHCLLVLRGVLTHWHPTGHSLTLVRAGAGTVMHRSGFEGYRAFFFFLAADGIRDADVTGVQTCALPICGGNGLLLSRSRFMFLEDFRKHFSDKVFAELRGVSDASGQSPLWDALGSKFFDMEFSQADRLSGLGNKAFIAELMPKYPIYLPMLPESARAVIGRVHDNTLPALKMLEAEGFNFNGMVDIFDGGPVVEAFIHNIRSIRESVNRHAMVVSKPVDLDVPPEQRVMISNRSFRDFRVTTIPVDCIEPDTIRLPREVADALRVESGDPVRLAPLKDQLRIPHRR